MPAQGQSAHCRIDNRSGCHCDPDPDCAHLQGDRHDRDQRSRNAPVPDQGIEQTGRVTFIPRNIPAAAAVRADPQDAFAQMALALTRFHRNNLAGFPDAAERVLELNDGHVDVLAEIGHCFAFLGESDRAIALLDRALALSSPVHPGWYHFAHCWRLAAKHQMEAALVEISRFPIPGFFWFHAHLAWFHAELGHLKSAWEEAAIMLELYPSFETRVHEELDLACYDDLKHRAIRVWQTAGLDIKPRQKGAVTAPQAEQ